MPHPHHHESEPEKECREIEYGNRNHHGHAFEVTVEDRGQVEAARRLDISLKRLNEIVLGKRGITADTALRLARLLKTSPQFWMRLQADWDLQKAVARAAKAS